MKTHSVRFNVAHKGRTYSVYFTRQAAGWKVEIPIGSNTYSWEPGEGVSRRSPSMTTAETLLKIAYDSNAEARKMRQGVI